MMNTVGWIAVGAWVFLLLFIVRAAFVIFEDDETELEQKLRKDFEKRNSTNE
jgi:hypothetical protein